MPEDQTNILEFFSHTGWMAKAVLAILLLFSFISWVIIIAKFLKFQQTERHTRRFIDLFHKSKRFSEVNSQCGKLYDSPLVGLFQAGYSELEAQIKSQKPSNETTGGYRIKSLDGIQRSLTRAVGVESANLAKSLNFLATTASATPFIGLFGTVWGIMNAFRNIGVTGSTSIVTVAPGISEALINTAAGLGAAIPALIAYNYYAQKVRRLRGEMEDFGLEFLNLTERNFT